MAKLKPEVEWFDNYNTWERSYGLVNLAGKWAVAKSNGGFIGIDDDFDIITEWVDDRKTAIGFLKLLLEK